MNREIERKFLVQGEYMSGATTVINIRQGYLSRDPLRTVRIRVTDNNAFITVKGKSGDDLVSRFEWEKEIPVSDAVELLKLCLPGIIEKKRYIIPWGKHNFSVDKFKYPEGIEDLAEIELSHPEEYFDKPEWLGREVTGEERYYNSSM